MGWLNLFRERCKCGGRFIFTDFTYFGAPPYKCNKCGKLAKKLKKFKPKKKVKKLTPQEFIDVNS